MNTPKTFHPSGGNRRYSLSGKFTYCGELHISFSLCLYCVGFADTIVSAAEHQRTQNNLVFDEHAPAPYEEEDTLTPRQRPLLPLDPLLATSPSRENVNAPSREASNLSTSRGVEKVRDSVVDMK